MPPELRTARQEARVLATGIEEAALEEAMSKGQAARSEVAALVRAGSPLLPRATVRTLTDTVLGRLEGYGRLTPFMEDPDVTEVMVNGGEVWVERHGQLIRLEVCLDPLELQRLIERMVGPAGARVDRVSPIVDVRLPDGSRANIVLPPLAPDGPCVTIRRFVLRRAALSDFAEPEVAQLLATAVHERTNLVVCGGTGSGKTTLLNALAAHVPASERIVTIEDTAELRLEHPHVVRLEARQANTEGVGEVGIRSLVRTALRMRPDRILVGEARGGEVMDMLQAMNTGHAGSMSTCHANSPRHALRRLEALALLGGADLSAAFVHDQLASALQLVVHVSREVGGARRVMEVVAVGPDADWANGHGLRGLVHRGHLGSDPAVDGQRFMPCPPATRARPLS